MGNALGQTKQQNQQNQPVYYDATSGQYYTETPKNNNPLLAAFAPGGVRTYLNGINNNFTNFTQPTATAVPTLADMFPSLYNNQSATSSDMAGLYGAGRFLTPAQGKETGGVLSNKTT